MRSKQNPEQQNPEQQMHPKQQNLHKLIWEYHNANFRTFALHSIEEGGSCGCRDPECKIAGKHPFYPSWQNLPQWNKEQMGVMLNFVETGFGVLMKDHLVIDIDKRNGGFESYATLCLDTGIDFEEVSSLVVETGGGGLHIYFSYEGIDPLVTHLKDYQGIDFKSSGYVVGAGSLHKSGNTYDLSKGKIGSLNPAPQQIIDKLKRPAVHQTSLDGQFVSVAESEIAKMLSAISPDCPYDNWIKIGMGVHQTTNGAGVDLWDSWSSHGLDYPGREEIDKHWHSFGKASNAVTIGTVIYQAKQNGYVPPVNFNQLEETEKAEIKPPESLNQKIYNFSLVDEDKELDRLDNQPWLIDNILPSESFCILYGESGAGKTFISLDMALAVASGIEWQENETESSKLCLYVSGEGGGNLRRRKRAWEQYHKVRVPNLIVIPIPILMDDPDQIIAFDSAISQIIKDRGNVSLIVLDTMARTMIGDENFVKEVNVFIRACDHLKDKYKATILVVHHAGKDVEKGARGSSAIKGATDVEISISGNVNSGLKVKCTKAKDSAEFEPVSLTMEKINLKGRKDKKGRAIESLVPRVSTLADKLKQAGKRTEIEEAIWCQLKGEFTYKKAIRNGFYESGSQSGLKPDSKLKNFNKAINGLESKGMIIYHKESEEIQKIKSGKNPAKIRQDI